MTYTDTVRMLTAYHLDPDNEAVKGYFERSNIWSILGVQRYELSYSAFLKWFFSQDATGHSQVKALLHTLVLVAGEDSNMFVDGWNDTDDMAALRDAILTGNYDIGAVTVATELMVGKHSNVTVGDKDKVDLYLRFPLTVTNMLGGTTEKTMEIFIENKVDSPEGVEKEVGTGSDTASLKQTSRYFHTLGKEKGLRKYGADYQLFVYLTPDGHKCDSKDFITLSYQNLVDHVFENWLRRSDVEELSKSLVSDFLRNLSNPFIHHDKGIIAMTKEARDLLVGFFERNKDLFMATIEAMQSKSNDDGDSEAADNYEQAMLSMKKAGVRRLYTIRGTGDYKMYQVVEEFVKERLKEGDAFTSLKEDIDKTVGKKFVSDYKNGVKIGSKNAAPHSFDYNGQTYYVTKELSDNNENANFRKFRSFVSKKYPDFKIEEI